MKEADSSKDVKALQKEWYARLSGEGFTDIEDTNRRGMPLRDWHGHHFKKISPESFTAKQLYYERARELLNTYEFDNKIHLKIWEMHCEGLSKRKIEATLKLQNFKRETIGTIIQLIASSIK